MRRPFRQRSTVDPETAFDETIAGLFAGITVFVSRTFCH